MMRGIQKVAEFDSSLLMGGAAGLGTYALTNALTRGAAEAQRQTMNQAIGAYAKTKSAPLIAGAVMALIVGAMVASKARSEAQRPTVTPQRVAFQRQGFLPGNIVPFPAGHSYYQ